MDNISATITSKGQITLPKTIRDVMGLNVKDTVNFYIQSSGDVIMKKKDEKIESIDNLLELFFRIKNVITISGRNGSGKTTLVTKVFNKYFKDLDLMVFDSENEHSSLKFDDAANVTILAYSELDIDSILKAAPDVVIFEEANNLKNFKIIDTISKHGIKVLIIKQKFSEEEISHINEHISVLVDRTKPLNVRKIEHVSVQESDIVYLPYYSA